MSSDIAVAAPNGAASLAEIGSALGAAGVDLRGGGLWGGVAHYLVDEPEVARAALAKPLPPPIGALNSRFPRFRRPNRRARSHTPPRLVR